MGKKRRRDVVPVKADHAEIRNRLFANQLRSMPAPNSICLSRAAPDSAEPFAVHDEHTASSLVITSWTVAGVPKDSSLAWFCDACESACTDEDRNGKCCPSCGHLVLPASDRPLTIVAVAPCLRCGLVFLAKVLA